MQNTYEGVHFQHIFLEKFLKNALKDSSTVVWNPISLVNLGKIIPQNDTVVNLPSDGSFRIYVKGDNFEIKPSTLDYYVKRNTLEGCFYEILQCNLTKRVVNYFATKHETKRRQREIVARTFPNTYSDPCKYQLIMYKP